jgi:hypothetical protein
VIDAAPAALLMVLLLLAQAAEQQWLLQHNLLPVTVQRKLRAGETVIAESHPAATVLWAEVMGGITQQQQQQQQQHLEQPSEYLSASNAGGSSSSSNSRQELMVPIAAAGAGKLSSSSSGSRGGAAAAGPVRTSGGLSPAEAVVRLNSLYTTWEELCAEQVTTDVMTHVITVLTSGDTPGQLAAADAGGGAYVHLVHLAVCLSDCLIMVERV